jgi:hypothetical protein
MEQGDDDPGGFLTTKIVRGKERNRRGSQGSNRADVAAQNFADS